MKCNLGLILVCFDGIMKRVDGQINIKIIAELKKFSFGEASNSHEILTPKIGIVVKNVIGVPTNQIN